MDCPIPTSVLLESYGDVHSQGLYHHPHETLCPPPSAYASCLHNARAQDGSHWALDSAIVTHAHTRVGNGLLYPGSCPQLAEFGATSGLGALTETNAPSLQSPYTGMRKDDFRTQGRNTHDRPGLSIEETQQREGKCHSLSLTMCLIKYCGDIISQSFSSTRGL